MIGQDSKKIHLISKLLVVKVLKNGYMQQFLSKNHVREKNNVNLMPEKTVLQRIPRQIRTPCILDKKFAKISLYFIICMSWRSIFTSFCHFPCARKQYTMDCGFTVSLSKKWPQSEGIPFYESRARPLPAAVVAGHKMCLYEGRDMLCPSK